MRMSKSVPEFLDKEAKLTYSDMTSSSRLPVEGLMQLKMVF